MVYYKVCFEIKKGVLWAKQKCIPKLMVKIGNFSINSPLKELTEQGSEKFFQEIFDFFGDSDPIRG